MPTETTDLSRKTLIAVLNAMREPTPAMVEAAENAGWPGVEFPDPATAWKAMIDEVLKDAMGTQ